jgi:hypothetical protein
MWQRWSEMADIWWTWLRATPMEQGVEGGALLELD